MEAKDIKQRSVHILQDEEIHNLHKLPKVLFLHLITLHEQDDDFFSSCTSGQWLVYK
jgi:hypothetical protein